jgi:hypothetical protein
MRASYRRFLAAAAVEAAVVETVLVVLAVL